LTAIAEGPVRDKAKTDNKNAVVAQMRRLKKVCAKRSWVDVVSFMKGQEKWKEKMSGIKDCSWIAYAKRKRK